MCECLFNEDGSGFLCEACAPTWAEFEAQGGMAMVRALRRIIKNQYKFFLWETDEKTKFVMVRREPKDDPDPELLSDTTDGAIDALVRRFMEMEAKNIGREL